MTIGSLALMALAAISATAPGASLDVRVIGGPRPVEIVLRPTDGGDAAARKIASTAPSTVSFGGLEPGTYIVLASGADPLARQAVRVRVDRGSRQRVEMRIRPQRVEGTVVRGNQPLAGVVLNLRHDDLGWTADLRADANGRFASELWQPGSYAVGISRGTLHNVYGTHVVLRDGALTIAVPVRQIRGRVIDAASGRGVAKAHVLLRTQQEHSVSTVGQRTDAEGAFLFDAVPDGTHRVSATADDYLIPESLDLTKDAAAELTFRLDSGRPRPLRVFDHHGEPVRNAEIVAASGNRVHAAARTGADGRATVPVPAEEVTLFVVAPNGGFAVVDRPFERTDERIDLTAPRSSLRLIARSPTGEPLPPISFIVAVDGRVVPPAVVQRMAKLQKFSLLTDPKGEVNLSNIPPGYYQFWPYDGEVERDAILAAPYDAPISVSVKSGPNIVAVDFEPKTLRFAAPPPR